MVKKRALREREREREREEQTNKEKKMTNRREKIGKRDACSMTSIFKLRAKKKKELE